MSALTLDGLRQAVLQAGLEIYRTTATEITLAERVRMHLMDSGVVIALRDGTTVRLTVRGQRSDFPETAPDELFELVRSAIHPAASPRGFREVSTRTREVKDPVDDAHVLDVWHELTFAKRVDALDALLEELRWALSLPKCISP